MSAVFFLRIFPVIFAGFFFPQINFGFISLYFFFSPTKFYLEFHWSVHFEIMLPCDVKYTQQWELASDLKWLSICLSIEVSCLLSCCCSVAKSCLTLVTPWTVAHQAPLSMGILQARILEWVAMFSSRGSSQPRDRTQVSHTASRFFTVWARILISSE